jgi:hypothetical protein
VQTGGLHFKYSSRVSVEVTVVKVVTLLQLLTERPTVE